MSVVFIGNLSQGKLLVTDAMVTSSKEAVTSYRNCKLKDKIAKGLDTHGYYSLVGDETILYGMQVIDFWASQTGGHFDATVESSMNSALQAAEKIVKVYERAPGYKQDAPKPQLSYVYVISDQKMVHYNISRQGNKYYVMGCREVPNNAIFINYAGFIDTVNIDIFQNAETEACIDIAFNYIKQHHAAIISAGKPSLPYEFENRFCGVLIPNEGEDILKLPFRSLDEFIINFAGGGWDLIELPPF